MISIIVKIDELDQGKDNLHEKFIKILKLTSFNDLQLKIFRLQEYFKNCKFFSLKIFPSILYIQ